MKTKYCDRTLILFILSLLGGVSYAQDQSTLEQEILENDSLIFEVVLTIAILKKSIP